MTEKIGIIGSGSVGQSLARGFVKHGYDVMMGTRNSDKLKDLQKEIDIKVDSNQKTAEYGDIVVFAVKGTAAKETLEQIEKNALENKIVIDATNPISDEPPEDGVLKYFTDINKSLMEELQELHSEAYFVKAFNSVGSAFMVNPDFESKPTMCICGNSQQSKDKVKEILDKFGFETEDMGKATAARAIEPIAMLWCIPGFLRNEWSHAFRLMKK